MLLVSSPKVKCALASDIMDSQVEDTTFLSKTLKVRLSGASLSPLRGMCGKSFCALEDNSKFSITLIFMRTTLIITGEMRNIVP